MWIQNSTISSNTVSDTTRGGGIYNIAGEVTLINTTINSNIGGGFTDFAGELYFTNCIFSNSSKGFDLSLNNPNTILTNEKNIVETCNGACPTFFSSNDPNLGDLQDNGGATFTHALLFPSDAIDNGISVNTPELDQREFIRDEFHDIGAYEFEGVALPVSLIKFEAKRKENEILLTWTTASEKNTSHFVIQRSKDSRKWSNLGERKSYSNSLSKRKYSFKDLQPLEGNNYYRLKQIDLDSTFEFTDIIVVNLEKDFQKVQIFPNPAENQIVIKFDSKISSEGKITINNLNGITVFSKNILFNRGKNELNIDVHTLPKGKYILQCVSKSNQYSRIIVIQ